MADEYLKTEPWYSRNLEAFLRDNLEKELQTTSNLNKDLFVCRRAFVNISFAASCWILLSDRLQNYVWEQSVWPKYKDKFGAPMLNPILLAVFSVLFVSIAIFVKTR
jgi:hypothetical protein